MWALRKVLAAPRPASCEEGSPGEPEDGGRSEKPVQYESMCKEWQQVSSQENFDGFRIEAGKSSTKHLQTSHSLYLGTQLRECGYIYQMGPSFISASGRTQLMGRYDLDGSANGRLSHRLTDTWEVKGASMSHMREPEKNLHEIGAEKTGHDWTAGVKLQHQGNWLVSGSFSQELTKRLTLGTDLIWFAGSPLNNASIASFAARFVSGKDIYYASYTRAPDFKKMFGGPGMPAQSFVSNSLKLNYFRKVSDRLSMGAEAELGYEDLNSSMKYGYEYTFRHARVQGSIDSAGRVACFVTDFMGFGFSGVADFFKGKYQFGFLFNVVPQPDEGK